MNSRIDEIYKTATDLKANLEFNQAEVQDLKKAGDPISEIEQELGEVHEQIGFHCGKIEYPDNRSRRNEIKFDGFQKSLVKIWKDRKKGEDGTGNSTQASLWAIHRAHPSFWQVT